MTKALGIDNPDGFGPFPYTGVPKRSAFVIDRAGVIQHAEVLEDASKVPDFDAIEAAVAKINKAAKEAK